MKHTILITALLLASLVSGCGMAPEQPPKGEMATVQFRPEALGGSDGPRVSVGTDVMNGARVSMTGKLVPLNEEWVALEQDNQTCWIPRDMVLLIRIQKPRL